ncbi:TerD family protein [Nocardia sp. NPDC005366]|uniref:TerD family protein n=1 Tax=Nocardia sp. NPDC005366 TaxID=3156878 RepID=UPI0033AFAFED
MSTPVDNEGAEGLAWVTMGLGWDPDTGRWLAGGRPDIDLNAAALLFEGDVLIDAVYHEQLMSQDGSVRLLADNVTGEGPGDDEVLTVDLTRISPNATTVVFLVTSYAGQSFEQIDNAFCRFVDGVNDVEFARYILDNGPDRTGFVPGKLVRTTLGWQYQPIGVAIEANHPVEAIPQLAPFLL